MRKITVFISIMLFGLSGFANDSLSITNELPSMMTNFERQNYYDQFVFKINGNCSDTNTMWFESTHSWGAADLGLDSQNRPLRATLSIQLFEDGTYWALYSESAVIEVEPGKTSYLNLFTKEGIEGRWSTNGDQINLSGLGTGSASTYESVHGTMNSFELKLTDPINNPDVLISRFNITNSITNIGPKGVSINQFCGLD
jgi:hypothetical protein